MLCTYFRRLKHRRYCRVCMLGVFANLPIRWAVSPMEINELLDIETGSKTYFHQISAGAYH
jgi:hypothetical protein